MYSTVNKMCLVIPAMLLCMIGDYCIGIEPRNSEPLGSFASSGWMLMFVCGIGIAKREA